MNPPERPVSAFVPPTNRGGPKLKLPTPTSEPSKKKSAATSALNGSGWPESLVTSQRTRKDCAPLTYVVVCLIVATVETP
jgi:hypothetical protein